MGLLFSQALPLPHDYMNVLPISHIRLSAKRPNNQNYPKEGDTSLPALLKRKRMDAHMDKRQVARLLGFNYKTYVTWEYGVHEPTAPYHEKLNTYLGIEYFSSPDDLASRMITYRAQHKLNQRQFGELVGYSLRTIERIEQRKEFVSEEVRENVREFLGDV